MAARIRRFVVERANVTAVMAYIRGQKEHHRTVTFLEEYRAVLKKHELDFDERYIFQQPE